jgi:hypothetical protein
MINILIVILTLCRKIPKFTKQRDVFTLLQDRITLHIRHELSGKNSPPGDISAQTIFRNVCTFVWATNGATDEELRELCSLTGMQYLAVRQSFGKMLTYVDSAVRFAHSTLATFVRDAFLPTADDQAAMRNSAAEFRLEHNCRSTDVNSQRSLAALSLFRITKSWARLFHFSTNIRVLASVRLNQCSEILELWALIDTNFKNDAKAHLADRLAALNLDELDNSLKVGVVRAYCVLVYCYLEENRPKNALELQTIAERLLGTSLKDPALIEDVFVLGLQSRQRCKASDCSQYCDVVMREYLGKDSNS